MFNDCKLRFKKSVQYINWVLALQKITKLTHGIYIYIHISGVERSRISIAVPYLLLFILFLTLWLSVWCLIDLLYLLFITCFAYTITQVWHCMYGKLCFEKVNIPAHNEPPFRRGGHRCQETSYQKLIHSWCQLTRYSSCFMTTNQFICAMKNDRWSPTDTSLQELLPE